MFSFEIIIWFIRISFNVSLTLPRIKEDSAQIQQPKVTPTLPVIAIITMEPIENPTIWGETVFKAVIFRGSRVETLYYNSPSQFRRENRDVTIIISSSFRARDLAVTPNFSQSEVRVEALWKIMHVLSERGFQDFKIEVKDRVLFLTCFRKGESTRRRVEIKYRTSLARKGVASNWNRSSVGSPLLGVWVREEEKVYLNPHRVGKTQIFNC